MINFDAETHTYTNENGEVYDSVSTVIGKYKKPFDAEQASFFVARKRGISQEAVKEEWRLNTEQACDFGSNIHKAIENYLTQYLIEEQDREMINAFQDVFPYDSKDVNSEIILYSDKFKIAGTSDIIVDIGTKYFDVLDIKTNKKFDFHNKYNEYMLTPLEHLTNCKYSGYSLQLSIYAYLYAEKTGKTPRSLSIIYWDREKKIFNRYYTPYMFWDTMVLLKHHLKSCK